MLMCLLCSKLTIKTPKHAYVFIVFKINNKTPKQANVFIVLKINNKDTKTSLARQRMLFGRAFST